MKRKIPTWIVLALCLCLGLTATARAESPEAVPPSIETNLPGSLSVPAGGSVTMTVGVGGTELSYQWYKNDEPMDGQTAAGLTIAGASAADAGRYFCYIQNAAGAVRSSDCQLTVIDKPVLTQDISAAALTVNAGDTITLSAQATGGSILAQWYCKKSETDIREIPGGTGSTLSVTAAEEYNGTEFYCQFVNEAGGTVTSTCRVTVVPAATPTPKPDAPKETKPPYGETVNAGESAVFIARADNVTAYRWRFINPNGTAIYDYDNMHALYPSMTIAGGNTDTITVSNIPAELDGWKVACLFIGDGGETLSGEAVITVRRAASTLSIIAQPVGGTMALDENLGFTLSIQVTASDGGTFSYQWYSADTAAATAMRPVSGATNSSYKPERREGTTYYRVGVSLTTNGTTSEPYYSNTVPVTFTVKKAHVHSYSSAWDYNTLSHWHQCTCGDHADEALHSYEWTILRYPTASADGQQKGVCTVCGYETVQPIPAGSMPEITPEPTPAPQKSRGVNWILIALAALAVCVIGGAAYLVIRVIRSDDEEDDEEGYEDYDEPDDRRRRR